MSELREECVEELIQAIMACQGRAEALVEALRDARSLCSAALPPPESADRTVHLLAETVAQLLERDPHHFSSRPCPTCTAVSALVDRAFGCERRGKA